MDNFYTCRFSWEHHLWGFAPRPYIRLFTDPSFDDFTTETYGHISLGLYSVAGQGLWRSLVMVEKPKQTKLHTGWTTGSTYETRKRCQIKLCQCQPCGCQFPVVIVFPCVHLIFHLNPTISVLWSHGSSFIVSWCIIFPEAKKNSQTSKPTIHMNSRIDPTAQRKTACDLWRPQPGDLLSLGQFAIEFRDHLATWSTSTSTIPTIGSQCPVGQNFSMIHSKIWPIGELSKTNHCQWEVGI